jgi:hypothetical protein
MLLSLLEVLLNICLIMPAVCMLNIPPRIHIFLWLLSNTSVPKNLLVYAAVLLIWNQYITYFFECFVAYNVWDIFSDIVGVRDGFESPLLVVK